MDPVEELGEARPVLNWISSRNSRVVELCHDLETAPLSQAFDCLPLSFLPVFVVADAGGGQAVTVVQRLLY